jgi:hypothetical protein
MQVEAVEEQFTDYLMDQLCLMEHLELADLAEEEMEENPQADRQDLLMQQQEQLIRAAEVAEVEDTIQQQQELGPLEMEQQEELADQELL